MLFGPGGPTINHQFFTVGPLNAAPTDSLPLTPDTLQKSRFSSGFMVGVHTELIDPERSIFSTRPRIGYLLRYHINDQTALQAGLDITWASGYEQQSAVREITPNDPTSFSQTVFRLNHIGFMELPLLIRRQTKSGQFAWVAGLTPTLIVPLDDSYRTATGSNPPPVNRKPSLREGVNRYDLGVTVGMAWKISRSLWLDCRYNHGLADITNNNFFHNNAIHRHSGVQVSLFVPFIMKQQ